MRRATRILGIIACLVAIIPTVACGQSTQNGKSTGNAARSEAEIKEMATKCAPQSWIDEANRTNSVPTKLSADAVKYLNSDCTPKWMVNLDKDQLYSQVKDKDYYCTENCKHVPSYIRVGQIKNDFDKTGYDLSDYQSIPYSREFKGDNDSLTIDSPLYGPISNDGTVYAITPNTHDQQIHDMAFVLELNAKQVVLYESPAYGLNVFRAS